MSVRVNLLPEATRTQDRANQQRLIAAAGLLALFAVLGGVWWWTAGQVRDAEDRLAAAELVTTELRGEEAELIAYRDLADRREAADASLRATFEDEVSIAGLLQDLAAVMPDDAQLDTLALTVQPPSGARPDLIGSMTLTGQSLASHAPGVESLLIALGKMSSFDDLFLNSSTLDPEFAEPVVMFGVEAGIRASARTQRYADGLPGGAR